ncbi:SRPBCC family protein [Streptomyces sp.]|uniref:SRPBCC family protein n=1 Tax=Streptomyces sp. TaxID=1931 RepID=UPI002F40F971
MTQSTHKAPPFEVRIETEVAATPEEVYAVVSDMPRTGEWSEECQGGAWVIGSPATVGAVFEGRNYRPESVVAWAPVVRGEWFTRAEVVAAEPDRAFRWAMCDSAGKAQESVWSFEIEPADGGSRLVHHFRMDSVTEGIRGITSGMGDAERRRFFSEWQEKLFGDMSATVARLKNVIEKDAVRNN